MALRRSVPASRDIMELPLIPNLKAMGAFVNPVDDLIDMEEALANFHGTEMLGAVLPKRRSHGGDLMDLQDSFFR